MGLFRKKKNVETGLVQLNNLLTSSFQNVQKDTAYIMQWLGHFYNKNLQQEQQIKQLQEQLNYVPKSKQEIRNIVDEFYSYEPLLNRIKELNQRVESLRESHNELHQKHHELSPKFEEKLQGLKTQIETKTIAIPEKLSTTEVDHLSQRLEKLEAKKATIKEKIIKRITKNSKDYIKSIILSYIRKYGKITALQLKEMVVEEQGLCSKSSFYRLLDEIEEEPEIGVIKKEKRSTT